MASIEGKRNESQGSFIQRIFPSTRSSSRVDLQRIESGVSVISNAIKKTRKKSKNTFDRGGRKSSHPFLRRIPTDASEFRQLSESSSLESLDGVSKKRTKYFDPNTIKEVRELIEKDAEFYPTVNMTGNLNTFDRKDGEATEEKFELSNKTEKQKNSNRLKLEQIQEIQTQMMADHGNVLNYSCDSRDDLTNVDQTGLSHGSNKVLNIIKEKENDPVVTESSYDERCPHLMNSRNSLIENTTPLILQPVQSSFLLNESTISINEQTIHDHDSDASKKHSMLIKFDKSPENPS